MIDARLDLTRVVRTVKIASEAVSWKKTFWGGKGKRRRWETNTPWGQYLKETGLVAMKAMKGALRWECVEGEEGESPEKTGL